MRALVAANQMRTRILRTRTQFLIVTCILLVVFSASVNAQENYEIQVYGSETIPRGVTMIELHNNFTAKGAKITSDGTLPTHHAWHETIEITHGFNEWYETASTSSPARATATVGISSGRTFDRAFACRQNGNGRWE
jgi:hypothetical protein